MSADDHSLKTTEKCFYDILSFCKICKARCLIWGPVLHGLRHAWSGLDEGWVTPNLPDKLPDKCKIDTNTEVTLWYFGLE